jgi:hypothetical protein
MPGVVPLRTAKISFGNAIPSSAVFLVPPKVCHMTAIDGVPAKLVRKIHWASPEFLQKFVIGQKVPVFGAIEARDALTLLVKGLSERRPKPHGLCPLLRVRRATPGVVRKKLHSTPRTSPAQSVMLGTPKVPARLRPGGFHCPQDFRRDSRCVDRGRR